MLIIERSPQVGNFITVYVYGVGLDSSRKADTYKEELQRRGFMI